MNLNDLKYGNPNRELFNILSTESYLDTLISDFIIELSVLNFPPNESASTREDLQKLVELTTFLSVNENAQKQYSIYNNGIEHVLHSAVVKDMADEIGKEKISELLKMITDIIHDVYPLIIKLKFYFQRPRPFQLASYLNIDLYPIAGNNVQHLLSPSYPSGSACLSELICQVIGIHYPKYHSKYMLMSSEYNHSLMLRGLNYGTDIYFGIMVAKKILSNITFRTKFKL